MKKIEKLQKLAKAKAYTIYFNQFNIALSNNKRSKRNFDLRTKLDTLAYCIYNQLEKTVNKQEIRQKQRSRAKAKNIECKNILENKLLLDFKRNKGMFIYENHLTDGYRNHWAKSKQDLKVIEVLRKNNPKLAK